VLLEPGTLLCVNCSGLLRDFETSLSFESVHLKESLLDYVSISIFMLVYLLAASLAYGIPAVLSTQPAGRILPTDAFLCGPRTLFSALYFLKEKCRLMRSPSCLCVCPRST
jgi:hypothetical protein